MALHPARSAQLLTDLSHTAINEELCPRNITHSSEARKDPALAGLVSIPEPPQRDRSCNASFNRRQSFVSAMTIVSPSSLGDAVAFEPRYPASAYHIVLGI
jgi:hypothetical protein